MLEGANESLLRYSLPIYGEESKSISLDGCVASMVEGQQELFYITTKNSPKPGSYHKIKTLHEMGVKIVIITKSKKNMIVSGLEKYLGRKMVDVEADTFDLSFLRGSKDGGDSSEPREEERRPSPNSVAAFSEDGVGLSVEEAEDFCGWFQAELGSDKVVACTPTCKFASLPARVIHHNGDDIAKTIRQLEDFDCVPLPKKHVEINPSHNLIVEINIARFKNPAIAAVLAEQVYDNCMINAGLMDDARSMVNRINDISMLLLKQTNTCDSLVDMCNDQ